jgi:hypothetical protein
MLKVELDYVGGTNPIYVGYATPGSATSVAAWRILRITYDGNANPLVIEYANGNDLYANVWDNRAGLSYS